jgi:hypothetical protein
LEVPSSTENKISSKTHWEDGKQQAGPRTTQLHAQAADLLTQSPDIAVDSTHL